MSCRSISSIFPGLKTLKLLVALALELIVVYGSGGFVVTTATVKKVSNSIASGVPAAIDQKTNRTNGNLPPNVYFEENRGQFDSQVRYLVRGTKGYNAFLTDSAAVYVVAETPEETGYPTDSVPVPPLETASTRAVAVFMRFANARRFPTLEASGRVLHETSYFLGSDAKKWRSRIPNYTHVRMQDSLEETDIIWRGGNDSSLEYDVDVGEGAHPSQLLWEIEGADQVEISADGSLEIKTRYGSIHHRNLNIDRNQGSGFNSENGFVILGRDHQGTYRVGFTPRSSNDGEIDMIGSLLSPPGGLSFSTYLGGSETDNAHSVAIDPTGRAIVAGYARSPTFPTTAGAFDTTHNNNFDVFVSKLNPSGSGLVYSTFIGGSANDQCFGIALDSEGNVYATGVTASTTFPTTSGSYDTSFNGQGDIFVSKLNSAGNQLVYSTFIGGENVETAYEIALDASGEVFVVGSVNGGGYPITPGALDSDFSGGTFDIVVSRLNATGTQLGYSTYAGGAGFDQGRGIAVDGARNAYITGYTELSAGGPFDVFAGKINPSGTAFEYLSFFGGNGSDQGQAVAVDSSGSAYIVGNTDSLNFPTTVGAFDNSFNGFDDVFVSKLNAAGNQLVYSTFIGGNDFDEGRAISLADSGNVYITGWTISVGYPTSSDGYDRTHNGRSDVFVTELNSSGTQLIYSTFLGGSNAEEGAHVTTDSLNNIYVVGTTSANYPTTAGAFDATHNGESDAFVSRLGVFVVRPKLFDYDGDTRADLSVRRPSDNIWYLLQGTAGFTAITWGEAGDRMAPADYDGDGKTDVAVFRPSTGQWYVVNSSNLTFVTYNWGQDGDLPVPTDRDNDGRSDLVLFRPSNNTWYPRSTATGPLTPTQFGEAGDKPMVGDFDADGIGDIALFRPSNNNWYIIKSSLGYFVQTWGEAGDIPTTGDFDGDGATDQAVFRPSTGQWYLSRTTAGFSSQFWGQSGDIPVAADYDGDGKTDVAVFRPANATWYIVNSTAGIQTTQFGQTGDVPTQSSFLY